MVTNRTANSPTGDSESPEREARERRARAEAQHRRQLRERYIAVETALAVAERRRNPVEAKMLKRELDAIAREFVVANRGLATVVAKNYFTAGGDSRRDDYIGAALTGLWEAFLKWDPDQSTFGNFSRKYIEGRVRRTVSSEEFNEISYGDFTARQKILQAAETLAGSLGHTPSDQEVADEAEVPVTLVERVRRPRVSSLDKVVNESGTSLGDLVAATESSHLDALEEHALWQRNLGRVAQRLEPRELFVVLRRTPGLDPAPPQSLVQIADLTGLGREILRRTEVTAKQKMHDVLAQATIGT